VSITTPRGFTAAGLAAGIKASGALDLALVATDDGVPVPTAATFTTNRAAAPPVLVSREHLAASGGRTSAVVVSSGNANAATGILTTDSGRKEVLVEGHAFSVAGMAKGAGMLAPNMATMLAFLTTDAAIEPGVLADLLRIAVGDSFNAMTVDGCTSTNDTVVLMASGRAGPADPNVVVDAVTEACAGLADQMVADAEGASKIVHVRVTGARSDGEAHRAARKVADSLLVKCSLNGEDPYWGRVASDLGSAGVDFEMDRLAIDYGGVTVCRDGVAAAHDAAAVARHLAGPAVDIHCQLGLADGNAVVMGVDLGYGYIDENRTTS